jgi:hypothetical protein
VAMRHTATIQRNTPVSDDSWGDSGVPVWEDYQDDVPCRAIVEAGREGVDEDRTVIVLDRRILFPLGTDITESDRVLSVKERGEVLLDGPMDVEAVIVRRTHLETLVKRVR